MQSRYGLFGREGKVRTNIHHITAIRGLKKAKHLHQKFQFAAFPCILWASGQDRCQASFLWCLVCHIWDKSWHRQWHCERTQAVRKAFRNSSNRWIMWIREDPEAGYLVHSLRGGCNKTDSLSRVVQGHKQSQVCSISKWRCLHNFTWQLIPLPVRSEALQRFT